MDSAGQLPCGEHLATKLSSDVDCSESSAGCGDPKFETKSSSNARSSTPSEDREKAPGPDKTSSWRGWAELENDPMVFNTLLYEWGVRGIEVQEVIPLDAMFDSFADRTYGLILLSRYTIPADQKASAKLPDGLWFANQTSTFSCATVALMNIINNSQGVNLGPHLSTFRKDTQTMTPKDRGLALDSFDHVRDVHNSFATTFDKMNVDLRLQEDFTANARKRRPRRRRKRGRQRAPSSVEDENGFHFVAYAPACGHVWTMDGLERYPHSLGIQNPNQGWLPPVLSDIQKQLEAEEVNQLEFSLLRLVSNNEAAGQNPYEEEMRRYREDWGPFISHMIRLHAERGDLEERLR